MMELEYSKKQNKETLMLYAVLVVGMVTRLKLKRSAVVITKNTVVAECQTPCKFRFNVNVIMVMCGHSIAHNVSAVGVVALSINLKLTTTLDRAITQNPCYVP